MPNKSPSSPRAAKKPVAAKSPRAAKKPVAAKSPRATAKSPRAAKKPVAAKSPRAAAKSPRAAAKSPAKGKVQGKKFKADSPLSPQQKKYCSCVVDVAAKQDGDCLMEKDWGKGKPCSNPYAICAKSTGTTSRECGKNYDLSNFGEDQLKAFAQLMGVSPPVPYSKAKMLKAIEKKKIEKYGE